MATSKKIPSAENESKDIPSAEIKKKEIKETNTIPKKKPNTGSPQNTVIIAGKLVEIKPMKLLYHRNRTSVFYHMLDMYPIPDILAMDEEIFGDGRDGDKALMDWLIAVTDDPQLITQNLDDIDSGTIYKLLAIYKRMEKIDEKEAKLKNALTPGKEN